MHMDGPKLINKEKESLTLLTKTYAIALLCLRYGRRKNSENS